jgi:hypothetical protein
MERNIHRAELRSRAVTLSFERGILCGEAVLIGFTEKIYRFTPSRDRKEMSSYRSLRGGRLCCAHRPTGEDTR